jgi:hypothetical protein
MTQIDKEAVERLCHHIHNACDCQFGITDIEGTLRALRAALDAAKARERVYQQFSHALLCDDANWATAIFCEHDFLRDFVDTLSPDPPIQERHALAEYVAKERAEAYRQGWTFAYGQWEHTASVPDPDYTPAAVRQETNDD